MPGMGVNPWWHPAWTTVTGTIRFPRSSSCRPTTWRICRCGASAGPSPGSAPSSLPQLLDRLAAWQREFDDNFHWDRGWRSARIRDRWASQAEELAADVRAELGTRAELTVRLWPLPGVVRCQRRFGLRRSNDRQA